MDVQLEITSQELVAQNLDMVNVLGTVTLKNMTEENKTEEKPIPIAEALIQLGSDLGNKQKLKVSDLVGHFFIATIEIWNRHVQASSRMSAPSEGGDKPSQEASSPSEDGAKDEK